jgi:hypothetical protein
MYVNTSELEPTKMKYTYIDRVFGGTGALQRRQPIHKTPSLTLGFFVKRATASKE